MRGDRGSALWWISVSKRRMRLSFPQGEQAKAEAAVELQKGMFGTALDMALRQVAGTKRLLEEDRKSVAKQEFKANPVRIPLPRQCHRAAS